MDSVLQLSQERVEKLTAVFRRYDIDGDGFLNARELQLLGWAISGCRHVPSHEATAVQMARVTPPGSSLVSLPAFLAFSIRLARLPDDAFSALMALLEDGFDRAAARAFELPAAAPDGGPGGRGSVWGAP
jgi:hypothetical protein